MLRLPGLTFALALAACAGGAGAPSRTWVFIRHADRLELRHDHRHPDGTEERNTWYGATTLDAGTATRPSQRP